METIKISSHKNIIYYQLFKFSMLCLILDEQQQLYYMKQKISKKQQQSLNSLLYQAGFCLVSLEPKAIQKFQQLGNDLSRKLFKKSTKTSHQIDLAEGIQTIIKIVMRCYETINLDCIVKKLALLHTLIRKISHEQLFKQSSQEAIRRQINMISNKNLSLLFQIKQPEKRASSLTKLYGLIKQKYLSKEKKTTVLEKHQQKGALRQICDKIVEPYCRYLLKILQDYHTYSNIVHKNVSKDSIQTRWKMIQWGKSLGSIILQLHRVSRYFKSQLQAFLIFMNCIIAKDISIYYDVLKKYIEKQASYWHRRFYQTQMTSSMYRQLLDQPNFMELKEIIDQVNLLKEHIHHIFGNKELKQWRCYFEKSDKYQLSYQRNNEAAQFVMQLAQKVQKYNRKNSLTNLIHKTDSTFSVNNTQDSSFSYLLELSQRQKEQNFNMFVQHNNKDQLFSSIQQSSMNAVIAKTRPAKQRMNFFRQSVKR